MKVLVTGGAGYIGSNVCQLLIQSGMECVVVDNLSTGRRGAVPKEAAFYEQDVGNSDAIARILRDEKVDSLLHFAAFVEVEESVRNPQKYYWNNTFKSGELFKTCLENNVQKIVFSSTAAAYGEPAVVPVDENAPLLPINPYGRSKVMSETILKDLVSAKGNCSFVALRYFNVAGANKNGWWGQTAKSATHLVRVAAQTALGIRPQISVFGSDYKTLDGTCVRDYIHIDDLAEAHFLALEYLNAKNQSEILNCGYGHGSSVLEVLNTMKKVSDVDFKVKMEARRPGDPATLVAKTDRIRQVLKWTPKCQDLNLICKSAFEWEKRWQSIQPT